MGSLLQTAQNGQFVRHVQLEVNQNFKEQYDLFNDQF